MLFRAWDLVLYTRIEVESRYEHIILLLIPGPGFKLSQYMTTDSRTIRKIIILSAVSFGISLVFFSFGILETFEFTLQINLLFSDSFYHSLFSQNGLNQLGVIFN